MFEDIHEIAENSAYLKAVEQKDVSLEMLEQLPPYSECGHIEEKLRLENKLTFDNIFNEATGFYMIKCFGDDTRLLTDRGFLFLDQLEALTRAGQDVRYAAYDVATKAIVYRPGRLVYPQGDGHLLSFTPHTESRRWAKGSGDYGVDAERQQGDAGHSSDCSRVSLRVTRDHDMFVQTEAGAAHRKVPAGDLLRCCNCPVRQQPPCVHRSRPLRLLAHAAGGVGEMSEAWESLAPVEALALDSKTAVDAFLELYGFWLSSGSLQRRHRSSGEGAVVFSQRRAGDDDFLHERLHKAGVPSSEVRKGRHSSGGEPTVEVLSSRWVDFFEAEAGGESPASASTLPCHPTSRTATPTSTSRSLRSGASDEEGDDVDSPLRDDRPVMDWALQRLSRRQLRLLLDGFHRGNGGRLGALHCLFTSSLPLRDALVVAALHAGYSAFFELHRLEAAEQCEREEGEAEQWRVCYSDADSAAGSALCEPELSVEDGLVQEEYAGRIWCVTVEHADHLVVAQRAHRSSQGRVTKASQPVVVGQCFLIADYAVDKAIFIKDVEAYKSMRFESARRKVAALLYQRFVSTEEPAHGEYKHGVSVFQLIQQSKGAEEKKERDGKVQPASINLSASPSHAQSMDLKTVLPPASPLHSVTVTATTTNGHPSANPLHSTIASSHLNGHPSPHPSGVHPSLSLAPPITPSSPSHAASTLLQMGTNNNPIGVYGKSVRLVREKVNRGEAPKDLFDEVARDVMTDLKLDAFPRFKQGDFYRRYIRTKFIETQKVLVKDFTTFRVLGRGGFGAVHACRKKNSGQIYAMKVTVHRLTRPPLRPVTRRPQLLTCPCPLRCLCVSVHQQEAGEGEVGLGQRAGGAQCADHDEVALRHQPQIRPPGRGHSLPHHGPHAGRRPQVPPHQRGSLHREEGTLLRRSGAAGSRARAQAVDHLQGHEAGERPPRPPGPLQTE